MFFRRALAVAFSSALLLGSSSAMAGGEGRGSGGFSGGLDMEAEVGIFGSLPFAAGSFDTSIYGRGGAAPVPTSLATIKSAKVKNGMGAGLLVNILPDALSPVYIGAKLQYDSTDYASTGSSAGSSVITDAAIRGEVGIGVSMGATESVDIYGEGFIGIGSHKVSSSFTSDVVDTATGPGTGSFSGLAYTGYSASFGAGFKIRISEGNHILLGYQYQSNPSIPASRSGSNGMTSTYSYYSAANTVASASDSSISEFRPGAHVFRGAFTTRFGGL